MTRHGSHTESRMRENCTYGSMRGSRRKTAKSVLRVVEDRAGVPYGGVPLYSTPSSFPNPLQNGPFAGSVPQVFVLKKLSPKSM